MKRPLAYLFGLGLVGAAVATPIAVKIWATPSRPGWNGQRFTLPNGWRLTPVGTPVPLPGDMPGNILVLDNDRVLVNTSGFHDHSLNLINLNSGRTEASLAFERSWIGLAQTPDGKFLMSGGAPDARVKNPSLYRVSLADKLTLEPGVELDGIPAKERFVSSILTGKAGTYVLNIQSDDVLLLDREGKTKITQRVGYRPYAAALSPDGTELAVSLWGAKSVTFLDAATLAPRRTVAVGPLPGALLYAPDGRLLVAVSGSDHVAVIRNAKVVGNIRTGIDRTNRLGATPNALALAPDAKRLYVSNAGNNCVTVVDLSDQEGPRPIGFIPTARYPSALAVTPDGKRLLVATAKGFYGPNAGNAVPLNGRIRGGEVPYRYIGEQLSGSLAIVDIPDDRQLAAYSQQVVQNAPLGLAAAPAKAERDRIQKGAFDKIKHVIYVIKENRTYDQVLGDVPRGNGDPTLTMFGRKITPNEHKIVETFTLFDNLYADGETSQVGHQWTDAAYASDNTEKQWILNYGRHGEVASDTRLTSSPGEYLWTQARKQGLSARVYGEYVDVQEGHDSLESEAIKADPEKYGYSATWEKIFARGGRDTEKIADFLKELAVAEKTGKLPALMVMALPDDHTHGFSAGSYSPRAMVGDNDLAVGRLVEAMSKSRFWKETAIFIIQDDAQDGPDHVDSHRTVGMVVSPYVKRGHVDSTQYSTVSMIRTMGLILGFPPLSQYDAKTTPMYAAFTTKPDFSPYTVARTSIDLNERNPAKTALAKASAKLDFDEVDRADWDALNRMLWTAYKPGRPYPGPTWGR